MKWFGESWGAPICDPDEHVETPDGEVCGCGCLTTIRRDSQGFVFPYVNAEGRIGPMAWHRACLLNAMGLSDGALRALGITDSGPGAARLQRRTPPIGAGPGLSESSRDGCDREEEPKRCPQCGAALDWRIAAGCPKCDWEDK